MTNKNRSIRIKGRSGKSTKANTYGSRSLKNGKRDVISRSLSDFKSTKTVGVPPKETSRNPNRKK